MTRRAVAALAVLLLAGCASAVSGSGTVTNTPVPPSASDSASFPSASASFPSASASVPTSVPPSLPPSTATSTPGTGSGTNFTTVAFTVPDGFVPGQGYSEAVPLEASAPIQDFIVPRGGQGGLDIISVLVYVLPTPGIATTSAQQRARIETYNAKLKVKVLAGINPTTVSGLPAFQESVLQPGGSQNPRGYRYATWFVFGRTRVVQISCQIDKRQYLTLVENGCTHVVSGIKIT